MYGIVGLFLKDDSLSPDLGAMLSPMLESLSDRGPDSAGFAIYGDSDGDRIKVTIYSAGGLDKLKRVVANLAENLSTAIAANYRDNHAVLTVASEPQVDRVVQWLACREPDMRVTGAGKRIEIYKDIGSPREVTRRLDLAMMTGTHAIGHTRMATELPSPLPGAHPFSTGLDQCLVHNGYLCRTTIPCAACCARRASPSTQRTIPRSRRPICPGECARACPSAARSRPRSAISTASTRSWSARESGFGVLRDPVACKPAVMAETDSYVAFGTEYRALADLPGIGKAHIWEPEHLQVYFWEHGQ